MKARENAVRWIEALQILADGSDNLGELGRAGLAESRRTMLDAAYAEARAEVLAEAAALADPAKPEVSFFGGYGPQVAWWLRMLVGRHAQPAAEPAPVPDFFQPGRTYAHDVYRFRCEYLTAHPTSGLVAAWGWFGRNGGWRHTSFSRRQFEVRKWTDVTETEGL